MDLATLKEENKLPSTALLSEVFAPRYMTRSRVMAEVNSKNEFPDSEPVVRDTISQLAKEPRVVESNPNPIIEWETSSDTQAPSSEAAPVDTPSSQGVSSHSSSRKRGRHKEYTAPTGVWKTNGGYISTIYVGNRRIYGPLRERPEDAGMDREKLLQAKSFAKTEADMRTFIASLKGGNTSQFVTNSPPTNNPSHNNNPEEKSVNIAKRKRPMLTTCTSSTTIIVTSEESTVLTSD
jgi:hypothetical protein